MIKKAIYSFLIGILIFQVVWQGGIVFAEINVSSWGEASDSTVNVTIEDLENLVTETPSKWQDIDWIASLHLQPLEVLMSPPLNVFVSKTSKCSIDDNLSFEDACETININEPNVTQFQKLCGIGISTANNINEFLQTDFFTELSDITKVKNIGATTLQNIVEINQQCKEKQNLITPPPNDNAKLLITEVYYDDCEHEDRCDPVINNGEWIEIFNIWSWSFNWSFMLSGNIYSENHSSFIYKDVYIPPRGYIILANDGSMFKNISEILVNADGNIPTFSIPDDEEILLELIYDEKIIDTFFVNKYRVERRNDYQVSFHKLLTDIWPIVTRAASNDTENIKKYLQANPWIFYTYAEDIVDYAYPPGQKPLEPTSPDICFSVEEDVVTISEVFRWWERYDPYIEFFIHEDIEEKYSGLLLSWSLLQTSLFVDLDEEMESYDRSHLQKNTRVLLTKQVGNLSEAGLLTLLYHPDFDIQSFSWSLEIYGLDGQTSQLLDIAFVLSGNIEKSTYSAWLKRNCWDRMEFVDDFSPGFWQEVLKYFSPTSKYNIKTIETIKYVGWWWGGICSCPTQKELCEEKPKEESIIENSNVSDDILSSSTWEYLFWTGWVKIIALESKAPESITLQSFLSYDIDFTKKQFYLKTSTASTKKYIEGILSANSIDTFSKNFWFLDAWACVYLYSWDNVLDEMCYSTQTQSTEKETIQKEQFNPLLYQLKIMDIVYDPPWTDADNEMITIQNLSQNTLDLSNIKMKVNTTNKKLTGILEAGEIKTFKGNFAFPNSTKDWSEVVVSLFYNDIIFDTYLYQPNTPKIEIQSWMVKVYSVLDGDTFRFRKEDGTLQSVRLLWVDAPESTTTRYRTTECFGQESKKYLTELIKNQNVRLEYDETQQQVDSYGRLIAYAYLGNILVNEKIIVDWYAKEYTYKTDYAFQSTFQNAEQQAKSSSKWLRSSSTCWQNIEEVPEVRGIDYDQLIIKILDLQYDPEWSDKDNEKILLSINASSISDLQWIDFSDNFKLTIFPRGEYSTWTTKNKSLESVWYLPLSSEISLKGDRQMPNAKATCVSLKYKEYIFDTKCYNPWKEEKWEESILSGEGSYPLPNIKITSILPNPSGKDAEKEQISLFRTSQEGENELNLSPDFYLLINNKTKKKLNGILPPNKEVTIKWSFSFPNTASCITLMKGSDVIDSFCYGKATDWVKFISDNQQVKEIPQEELSVIKKITLIKKDDQLCISYNKVLFSCKKIPNSTTEKEKKLLSFQNNYILEVQKYLKENYSLLYYDSELRDLFDFYAIIKKEIKTGSYFISRKGKEISLTNVASLWPIQYKQNAQEYLTSKLIEQIPPSLLTYYQQEREKWYQDLMES